MPKPKPLPPPRLPWRQNEQYPAQIEEADGRIVGWTVDPDFENEASAIEIADAARIVLAVNEHEALVRVLRDQFARKSCIGCNLDAPAKSEGPVQFDPKQHDPTCPDREARAILSRIEGASRG